MVAQYSNFGRTVVLYAFSLSCPEHCSVEETQHPVGCTTDAVYMLVPPKLIVYSQTEVWRTLYTFDLFSIHRITKFLLVFGGVCDGDDVTF